jgi:glycine cleavage system regulatory protein
MNTPIVLTVISPDRPGIIRTVSEALKNHGGNWTQSSMSTLAGQFAGILLASVPEQNTAACLDELRGLESQGLHVIAEACEGESLAQKTKEYSLDLVGNDHPGIVHTITTLLANHNISVRDLETTVESGSMAGGMIFRARALLQVPESTDIGELEYEIEDIANDLMVDIRLEK